MSIADVTNAEAVAYIVTHKHNGPYRPECYMLEALLANRGMSGLLVFERGVWRWDWICVAVSVVTTLVLVTMLVLWNPGAIAGLGFAGVYTYHHPPGQRVRTSVVDLREAKLRGWV